MRPLPNRLRRSPLEVLLAWQMDAERIAYVSEFRFDERRRWRLDFAFPSSQLGVEIEGGGWVGGRHNRPIGMAKDMEKYNTLALLGWRILRFDGKMVKTGIALATIKKALSITRS